MRGVIAIWAIGIIYRRRAGRCCVVSVQFVSWYCASFRSELISLDWILQASERTEESNVQGCYVWLWTSGRVALCLSSPSDSLNRLWWLRNVGTYLSVVTASLLRWLETLQHRCEHLKSAGRHSTLCVLYMYIRTLTSWSAEFLSRSHCASN